VRCRHTQYTRPSGRVEVRAAGEEARKEAVPRRTQNSLRRAAQAERYESFHGENEGVATAPAA